MKKILVIIILLALTFTFNSCSKDYFNVNVPSGTADVNQLNMSDLLGPVIYHSFYADYYAERSFGNYAQNFTGQGGAAAGKTSISGTWAKIYLKVLPNLKVIRDKATAKNAIHYDAVAKILTVVNISLATDSWDWIPFSEANQGSEDFHPAFDSQESVYNELLVLLDSAINQLESTDNSGYELGNDDLVYHGDTNKWLKFAYTLKARLQLHVMNKKNIAPDDIIANLDNGFDTNADDFQLYFDSRSLNPWYSREILSRATGNDHDKIGDQLVSYMNGSSYPFTGGAVNIDPRLPIYAEKDNPADPWRGYVSGGQGISSDGADANTDFKTHGFYTDVTSPIVILSYAEAEFMRAELEFLKNGGSPTSIGSNTNAYDAYLAGIEANMDKLGVDPVLKSDYLADPSIDVTTAGLKLEHIMKEKYIANFLNPETFVDFRRYDFSSDVFKDLDLPADNASSEYPGEWYRRAIYPATEASRNEQNVNAHKQSPVTPVWWDQ